jgi:hypothetical protein
MVQRIVYSSLVAKSSISHETCECIRKHILNSFFLFRLPTVYQLGIINITDLVVDIF